MPASAMSLGMRERGLHYARLAMLRVLVVHLPGEAEIDDFDVALAVDEDVRRLQVAMHNVPALRVNGAVYKYLEIEKAAEELVHNGTDVRFTPIRNALGVAEKAVKVPASVFLAITLLKTRGSNLHHPKTFVGKLIRRYD